MLALVVGGATSAKAQDPLPSWNNGPAKQAILAFVKAVTDKSDPKYVAPEDRIATNLYPGQIFKGKVDSIWKASGNGQLLPSGTILTFNPPPPDVPQGRFAVRILFENKDQSLFPIGAQGAAAIYAGGGAYAALRRIVIRSYSWWNWIYPLPF